MRRGQLQPLDGVPPHQLDRPLRCEDRLQDDGVAVQQGVEERGERGGMVQRPDDELPLLGAPAGLPDHQGRRPDRVVAQWSRSGGDLRNARARAGCQQVRHGAELAWAFGRGAELAWAFGRGAGLAWAFGRGAAAGRRFGSGGQVDPLRPELGVHQVAVLEPPAQKAQQGVPLGRRGARVQREDRHLGRERRRDADGRGQGIAGQARRHTTACAGPAPRPVRRPCPRPGSANSRQDRTCSARSVPKPTKAVRSGSARAMSAIRRRTDRTIVTAGSLPAGGHWPRS